MGNKKTSKPQTEKSEGLPDGQVATVKVRNLKRQPVELRLLGIHYRFEPMGNNGSELSLPVEATKEELFVQMLGKYLVIGGI